MANDFHRRLHLGITEAQQVAASVLSSLITSSSASSAASGARARDTEQHTASSSVLGYNIKKAATAVLKLVHLDKFFTFVGNSPVYSASYPTTKPTARSSSVLPTYPRNELSLEACDLLNITACKASIALTKNEKQEESGVFVVVYNHLAHKRTVPVRVPVDVGRTCNWIVTGKSSGFCYLVVFSQMSSVLCMYLEQTRTTPKLFFKFNIQITGPDGKEVQSQLVPISNTTATLQQLSISVNITTPDETADQELVFLAKLPALGYSTFTIQQAAEPHAAAASSTTSGTGCDAYKQQLESQKRFIPILQSSSSSNKNKNKHNDNDATVSLTNGVFEIQFDTTTGNVKQVVNLVDDIRVDFELEFGAYNASDDQEQPGGAYIFRYFEWFFDNSCAGTCTFSVFAGRICYIRIFNRNQPTNN